MNVSLHGQLIDYIELNPAWTQHGNPERVSSGKDRVLYMSATYHGDHEQFWIIVSENGTEVARYNPRGVQHIRWSAERTGVAP